MNLKDTYAQQLVKLNELSESKRELINQIVTIGIELGLSEKQIKKDVLKHN